MWVLKSMTKVSRSLGHSVLKDGYQSVLGGRVQICSICWLPWHNYSLFGWSEATNSTSLKSGLERDPNSELFQGHFHTLLFTVQVSRGSQEHLYPWPKARNFQNMHWELSGRKCRKESFSNWLDCGMLALLKHSSDQHSLWEMLPLAWDKDLEPRPTVLPFVSDSSKGTIQNQAVNFIPSMTPLSPCSTSFNTYLLQQPTQNHTLNFQCESSFLVIVVFFFFFFFFPWPCGIWDLCSLMRVKFTPTALETQSLKGPPGKSLRFLCCWSCTWRQYLRFNWPRKVVEPKHVQVGADGASVGVWCQQWCLASRRVTPTGCSWPVSCTLRCWAAKGKWKR